MWGGIEKFGEDCSYEDLHEAFCGDFPIIPSCAFQGVLKSNLRIWLENTGTGG